MISKHNMMVFCQWLILTVLFYTCEKHEPARARDVYGAAAVVVITLVRRKP